MKKKTPWFSSDLIKCVDRVHGIGIGIQEMSILVLYGS